MNNNSNEFNDKTNKKEAITAKDGISNHIFLMNNNFNEFINDEYKKYYGNIN